jgi:PAS domain S-box-containing protein
MADPHRVLRRRRGLLQLALGGVLVALIVVVEVLIFQAHANVNRTTAIFGEQSYLNSTLVNAQREAVLLEDQIEDLPTTGDVRGVTIRRGLLGNQLFQAEAQRDDPQVAQTLEQAIWDLALIDHHLARIKADPGRAQAEVAVMQPAAHRLAVSIKQLFDAKEQGLFGAVSGALNARRSSERLLIGLSGLVLLVGLALSLSLRQRVRKDFARAYAALTAEVDERKAAERALRASEERFRSLVQNSSDVISIVDADGAVRYHSESVRRVLGYDPGELVDGDPLILVHPDDRERVARFVAEAALRPGVTAAETWRVRHRDGTWLRSETVAANLLEDANVRGLVLNTRDVSDRKELEAFIDLDDFKHVNDSLGHAAGDQLLVAAGRRLQGCLRPSDTAARLGGDEFAVLLERVTDADAAGGVAARILDTLHQPFGLNGRTIPIKASLGATVGRSGVDNARGAAAQRRRGHVRGQGRGQGPLRAVPSRHARGHAPAPGAGGRAAPRGRPRPAGAALPADRRAGLGPHHPGRGPGPLGPSGQGAAGAGPWRRPGCRRGCSPSRSPRACWSATSRP